MTGEGNQVCCYIPLPNLMKPDIQNRADITLLIDSFYEKVRVHPDLGYIFSEIAQVNWEVHLPIMYNFWASLLLDEQSYQGNPMTKHIALSKRAPMTNKEFSAWLTLFHETIDTLFEGEIASEAKSRATQIAGLMEYKILSDF